MRCKAMGAAAFAAALFSLGATAGAGASPASSETTTEHNGTETFGDYVPCAPVSGLDGWEITLVYNGVEHTTENGSGLHATFTTAGTFSASPVVFADVNPADGEPDVDPTTDSLVIAGPRSGESFSGRFTIWGGFNDQANGTSNGTFTFRGKGQGDQGTAVQWNEVFHATERDSVERVAFDRFRCH